MSEIKSTRLRFIKASTLEEVIQAVEQLPFKVEIKGMPNLIGEAWHVFFTIPDNANFKNVDLT